MFIHIHHCKETKEDIHANQKQHEKMEENDSTVIVQKPKNVVVIKILRRD